MSTSRSPSTAPLKSAIKQKLSDIFAHFANSYKGNRRGTINQEISQKLQIDDVQLERELQKREKRNRDMVTNAIPKFYAETMAQWTKDDPRPIRSKLEIPEPFTTELADSLSLFVIHDLVEEGSDEEEEILYMLLRVFCMGMVSERLQSGTEARSGNGGAVS
ncbi:hypothetical protein BS50DRAFT_586936 [Corynespora cassiicola Philippines]|uniref:Uncharacterized protein n=1 Tax=Corynespora cassiicola Philippines TaxID=1448308 RepID=A0A2T2NQY3_CORCC|nr:hypothetical protein BS50DRAFT_586936 [Corynespora cassiicola Philippines]